MKRTAIYIAMAACLASCEKEQHGCLLNKTAIFYVDNRTKDTARFELSQGTDTIKEYIMPMEYKSHVIKAGEVTRSSLYVKDTLYRKTMDGWKSKRCEKDGHLIRTK